MRPTVAERNDFGDFEVCIEAKYTIFGQSLNFVFDECELIASTHDLPNCAQSIT
ncbi:hypothetical protein NB311A_13256 [Nitrobacter sp. Nb-311A]|nr:hypothetical protein NB311A_13256 [Nitrobacter sp. Nb-311A]